MEHADSVTSSEGNPSHTVPDSQKKEFLLTAPVLLLAEHILGSIPLWEVKSKNRREGLREKEVVREVYYRGELRKIPLVIYASGDLGLPNSVDLELFRGFERWALGQLERKKTLDPIVKISGAEILQAAGKEPSGAAYAEVDRFFLRMAGTMISAGRTKTEVAEVARGSGSLPRKRLRSNKGIVFKIFGTVVLPGQPNKKGELVDKYEVELASWYRDSLLMGNCFVIDHSLFTGMKGSLSKLLHQLLHNLFYLGKGHAEQRYSDLVRYWQIKKYMAKSKVIEQFAEAHRELVTRGFLEHWQIVPVGVRDQKDFLFVWDAGSAWWKTEAQLPELKTKYELGETPHIDSDPVIDPFLTALPEPSTAAATASVTDSNSAARLLDEIMGLSGRRKDPDVWEKWWKRAIAAVPHPRIWLRIGEVKERKARGERINMGSYLAKLIKVEAKGLGLSWAEEEKSNT
ncbi:MAG: hypothetical protein A4E19_20955 [Nitrospira sp. SG-bin1]|nr:MAG: hypothetical protein A4E19_20955 [Nitrospira sp. SG-bin1]